MNRALSSLLAAIGLGGLIGATAALYTPFHWLIGALLGGSVAYITVDFRHLCAGIAQVLRIMAPNWKSRLWWHTLWWNQRIPLIFTTYYLVIMGIGTWQAIEDPESTPPGIVFMHLMGISTLATCVFIARLCLKRMPVRESDESLPHYELRLKRELVRSRKSWRTGWNGFMTEVLSALRAIPTRIATFFRVVWRFFRLTILFVHTERHATAFTYGALGAAGGSYFGSVPVALMIGITLAYVGHWLTARLLSPASTTATGS